jgi:hypothetical protein
MGDRGRECCVTAGAERSAAASAIEAGRCLAMVGLDGFAAAYPREVPSLRIVDDALWQRVKTRQENGRAS